MEDKKVHFRHIMLFYYCKGKNATQTHKKICSVYGNNAITIKTCQNWFQRFRAKKYVLEDAPRSGRASVIDSDEVSTLIAANRHLTTREIAAMLCVDQSTVVRRLHSLGMVNEYDVWVPQELNDTNLLDRINSCDSLLKRHHNGSFLKRLITGDDKWILYNNVARTKPWSQHNEAHNEAMTPKKILLSCWWDWQGVIYYTLSPSNETMNTDKYCWLLKKLKRAILQKRPDLANEKGIVFQCDNTKPYLSLQTRQNLLRFGWDVLNHPPHSPDLAPSDYYLFPILQNELNGMTFASSEHLKMFLDEFFARKPHNFYQRGIMQLPERWERVINQNGQYIID